MDVPRINLPVAGSTSPPVFPLIETKPEYFQIAGLEWFLTGLTYGVYEIPITANGYISYFNTGPYNESVNFGQLPNFTDPVDGRYGAFGYCGNIPSSQSFTTTLYTTIGGLMSSAIRTNYWVQIRQAPHSGNINNGNGGDVNLTK